MSIEVFCNLTYLQTSKEGNYSEHNDEEGDVQVAVLAAATHVL